MNDDYFIWQYQSVPFAAVLKALSGLDKLFRLKNGVPLQVGFPTDVRYQMHPDFPTDLVLVDNMLNLDRIAVVSARLKQAIEHRHPTHVEYLPLVIADHKGRIVGKDYFIIHPVDLVDCIDREQSVYEQDAILPENIKFVKRLVIDENRVPPDREIFRLKGFREVIVVRREMADALELERFSGLIWLPLRDYPTR